MKATVWKLEGLTSDTHYTQEQLRLTLNTVKGCYKTVYTTVCAAIRLLVRLEVRQNSFRRAKLQMCLLLLLVRGQ